MARVPCPICDRLQCGHTPTQRRQTYEQVMGDPPAKDGVFPRDLLENAVMDPTEVEKAILEHLNSGVERAIIRGRRFELVTKSGACLTGGDLMMLAPTPESQDVLPYLRKKPR